MDINQVHHTVVDSIEKLGYDLYGIEWLSAHKILRIFIDHTQGIGINDCVKVSEHVGFLLDHDERFGNSYRLEVSSPGIDRPLFCKKHYTKATGKRIFAELLVPIDGQKKFKGVLASCTDENFCLKIDDKLLEISFDQVRFAKVLELESL